MSIRFEPGDSPRTLPWTICLLGLAWLAGCAPAGAQPLATQPAATMASSQTATLTPPPAAPTASAVPATASATSTVRPTPRPTRSLQASATPTEYGPAATATATNAPVATAVSGDFTPAQASIWNTAVVGTDQTSGTCAGNINPPYGLVLLTPGADNLALHNTVPEDYVLAPAGASTYQYTGATNAGDGTLTLVIKFTSATQLTMTRAFSANAEPGCTHAHNFTGTFQYNR